MGCEAGAGPPRKARDGHVLVVLASVTVNLEKKAFTKFQDRFQKYISKFTISNGFKITVDFLQTKCIYKFVKLNCFLTLPDPAAVLSGEAEPATSS